MEIIDRRFHVPFMLIVSAVVAVFVFWLAMISPGVEGGMDSYNHYLIAKWSWKYPELLLDQWGKPLYTIMASPFAQLGMIGLTVFNISLLIATAWVTWACARKLHIPNSWIAFIIAITSPIFLINTVSGLTEPLSAFLLVITIALLIDERFVSGAILAGFLPYARSEGYVIMAVVGFYLLWKKEYRAFLFLLLGSLIMNLIGWVVLDDPIWVYNSNPYIKVQAEAGSSCGRGTWLHYVRMTRFIFGLVPAIMFALGSILILLRFIRNSKDKTYQNILFLIVGVFALYYAIHTLIWKFGLMGSCGYERVMVVIAPLLAIVALIGLNSLLKLIRSAKVKYVFTGLLVSLLFITPYKWYGSRFPIDISDEQKLFSEAAEWFNESDYSDRCVYHLYHYFTILTDMDPYDPEQHVDLWSFDHRYAPVGSIVIWDTHFGPNESKLPLKELQDHPDFREIKSFIPTVPFPTLNSDSFEIHVFERVGKSTLEIY